MKKTLTGIILVATLSSALFALFSVNGAGSRANDPVKSNALSAAEAATLTFIREEEKMARDVYLAMDEAWGLEILSQIAASEQEHMDAILQMLEKYGLPDPALGIGEFADEKLEVLYEQLITLGSSSELGALYAGATIEDYDIVDLLAAIEETDNSDLKQVYGNLEAGSENHLRAFVGLIEEAGETYAPQYLDPDTYQEILESTSDSGQRKQNGQ